MSRYEKINPGQIWQLKPNRGLPIRWRIMPMSADELRSVQLGRGFVRLQRDPYSRVSGPAEKKVRPDTLLGDYQQITDGHGPWLR